MTYGRVRNGYHFHTGNGAAVSHPAELVRGDLRQPRPSKGILVALMFMNSTLVSSGRLAM
jgi:hypothetical protein